MCKKVERVTAKTGCTSCTKWTISFEVSGFRTKTHLLHRHIIFLNNLNITKLNIMIKHTNIKHKKKKSLKKLFSKLSYSQTSDSHKFQIIQNFNNLLQLQTFLRSAGTIQSDVINFQPFLT